MEKRTKECTLKKREDYTASKSFSSYMSDFPLCFGASIISLPLKEICSRPAKLFRLFAPTQGHNIFPFSSFSTWGTKLRRV